MEDLGRRCYSLDEEQDSADSFSTDTSKKVKNTTNDPVGEGDTDDLV